jgi:hypothetical protein
VKRGRLERDSQRLTYLIVRIVEEVADAGLDGEQSVDAAQAVLARLLFVFGIGLRYRRPIHMAAKHVDLV